VNVHDEDIPLENFTVIYNCKGQKPFNSLSSLNELMMCASNEGSIIALNLEVNR
jgi:hypothetical protein